jgi:predicted glutamine amidotransferase
MCRLSLILSTYITKKNILKFLLQSIKPKFTPHINNKIDGNFHLDGFGLAWFSNNKWNIYKKPIIFIYDKDLINIINSIITSKPSIFIGHIRNKTMGDVILQNCHPFMYDNYIFCQNGYIKAFCDNKQKIMKLIDVDLLDKIEGSTDSEYLFYLILSFYKKNIITNLNNQLINYFKQINIEVVGNCIFCDVDTIYILRFYSKDNIIPSLYTQENNNIISSEPLIKIFNLL